MNNVKPIKPIAILPLQYKKRDLQPIMSAKTLDYHYEHLAKNYAINYNSGKGNPHFNKAGCFLHNIFFAQFNKTSDKPSLDTNNEIMRFINTHFGDFAKFKEKFKEEAMKIECSGCIYLSIDGKIKIIHNHQIHHDILLLVDWWEHAWALDYQSNKGAYIDNIWSIIDWNIINNNINSILK